MMLSNRIRCLTYIFFERNEAKNFIKKQGLNVTRYSGSRTSNIELLVRKPKIFVYNLEDFLELWEEKILTTSTLRVTNSEQNILEAELHFLVRLIVKMTVYSRKQPFTTF